MHRGWWWPWECWALLDVILSTRRASLRARLRCFVFLVHKMSISARYFLMHTKAISGRKAQHLSNWGRQSSQLKESRKERYRKLGQVDIPTQTEAPWARARERQIEEANVWSSRLWKWAFFNINKILGREANTSSKCIIWRKCRDICINNSSGGELDIDQGAFRRQEFNSGLSHQDANGGLQSGWQSTSLLHCLDEWWAEHSMDHSWHPCNTKCFWLAADESI